MKSEDLQKWALVAEILSGVAVVLSLVFVGFQIRQSALESSLNTRAIEVAAYQELSGQINAVGFESMTNPEFAKILSGVFQDEISDNEPMNQQVRSYLSYTMRHADTAYFQFKQGLISETQFQAMLAPLRGNLTSRIGKLHWCNQTIWEAEFMEYVEAHMAERYPSDAFWRSKTC